MCLERRGDILSSVDLTTLLTQYWRKSMERMFRVNVNDWPLRISLGFFLGSIRWKWVNPKIGNDGCQISSKRCQRVQSLISSELTNFTINRENCLICFGSKIDSSPPETCSWLLPSLVLPCPKYSLKTDTGLHHNRPIEPHLLVLGQTIILAAHLPQVWSWDLFESVGWQSYRL